MFAVSLRKMLKGIYWQKRAPNRVPERDRCPSNSLNSFYDETTKMVGDSLIVVSRPARCRIDVYSLASCNGQPLGSIEVALVGSVV